MLDKDKILNLICVGIGAAIIYINLTYFADNIQLFGMLNLIGAMIGLGIPLLMKYRQLKITSEIESRFPNFLRDVTASIETGMTLPQAIRSVKTNDYGYLSRYVKDISAKLEWGIDFEKVLNDFASKVKSKTITRSVRAINETHRSGGKIGTVLSAVSESQVILERVKKERTSSIYAQMLNGYVIFFVFIGVMFALSRFLLPSLYELGEEGVGETETARLYSELFRNLAIIQGVFAGIAIGKMAEGSVFAGIKHSLILVVISYTVFAFL